MRDLGPSFSPFEHVLRKGALVLLPPRQAGGSQSAGGAFAGMMLRFQYNPEMVTRTRSGVWEARRNNRAAPAGTSQPAQAPQEQSAAAFRGGGLLSKSETIALKLTFDATELMLAAGGSPARTGSSAADAADGILPELATLERMGISAPPDTSQSQGGGGGGGTTGASAARTRLNQVAPKELLLVLNQRVFPVIITSMTITEKRFSPDLVPLRAEVDLQMQILETQEVAGNQAMKDAFDKLVTDRAAMAAKAAIDIGQPAAANFAGTLSTIAQALSQAAAVRGVRG